MNVSFFSLFFNYYLSLCELTFKNSLYAAIKGDLVSSELAQPLVLIWQFFVFIFNIFLFTFALAISAIVSGSMIAAFFYKVLKVEDYKSFMEKWDGQWTSVILISLLILCFEYLVFRKELKRLNSYKVKDWNIFLPFTKNSKYKFNTYFYGSVLAVMIDGFFNDFNNFGYLCLIWLFCCSIIWSVLDVKYPPQTPPLIAYQEEVD
ncbi:MAG: hypothetical protein IT221_01885 [Fluviicola sp.]|nr:hypothetical protein [Fluviicola sp.]